MTTAEQTVVIAPSTEQAVEACHERGINPRRAVIVTANSRGVPMGVYPLRGNVIEVGDWPRGKYGEYVERWLTHALAKRTANAA